MRCKWEIKCYTFYFVWNVKCLFQLDKKMCVWYNIIVLKLHINAKIQSKKGDGNDKGLFDPTR